MYDHRHRHSAPEQIHATGTEIEREHPFSLKWINGRCYPADPESELPPVERMVTESVDSQSLLLMLDSLVRGGVGDDTQRSGEMTG